jgi:hypothetical protein
MAALMLANLLRDVLGHAVAAAVLDEKTLEAMLRPRLVRYGLDEAEIAAILAEARANLERWREEANPEVAEMLRGVVIDAIARRARAGEDNKP